MFRTLLFVFVCLLFLCLAFVVKGLVLLCVVGGLYGGGLCINLIVIKNI